MDRMIEEGVSMDTFQNIVTGSSGSTPMGHTIVLALLLGLLVVLPRPGSGEPLRATTADGHTVLLHANGTWTYQETATRPPPPVTAYTRPAAANTFVSGETVPYGIWLDRATWRREATSPQATIERRFTHTSGKAWAAVIAEPTWLSTEAVTQFVLASAKRHLPDATLLQRETRVVNGHAVVFLRILGTAQGVAYTYLTYDYTGPAGTVQVYTWTSTPHLRRYQSDMLDFLNGFEIYGAPSR